MFDDQDGCEWVNVYRPTQVIPDKASLSSCLCVCVYIYIYIAAFKLVDTYIDDTNIVYYKTVFDLHCCTV